MEGVPDLSLGGEGRQPVTPSGGATVGLLSDTHGLLRPEVLDTLRGCDRILHAGDVGDDGVLRALSALAPVTAVAGNCDVAPWARDLPKETLSEVAGVWIALVHDLATLSLVPAAAGVRVVVHGHSHRPAIGEHGGVLYVNPGSAGPRRFTLPVTAARLHVADGRVEAKLLPLLG